MNEKPVLIDVRGMFDEAAAKDIYYLFVSNGILFNFYIFLWARSLSELETQVIIAS